MGDVTALPRSRVLVVDDEDAVRETCAALLERTCDVTSVGDPRKALELLRAGEFDVLCTDLKMPGMSGLELIAALSELRNPPVAVLVTAYADYVQRDRQAPKLTFSLLMKPYTAQQLRDAVIRAGETFRIKRQLAQVTSSVAGSRAP